MRLNWSRTFVIGLGFFSISLVWSLYNNYMPIFYGEHIAQTWLVGFLMTLDNILAITLQPYFGALSDRPRGRWGRRMPFLLIGMPIAAVLFAFIPFVRAYLLPLVLVTLVMNLAMTIFRSPTIALMPDITPPALRSKANGIINLMGGLGALLIFFVGSRLYNISKPLPFVITAAVVLLAALVLWLMVKEPEKPYTAEEEGTERPSGGIVRSLVRLWESPDKSVLWLLSAVLLWFMGYQPVEALFTLYGKNRLGLLEGDAAFSLGFFSLSFLIFAIPSGYIATKNGRRKTISWGLITLFVIFLGLTFVTDLWISRILLLVGGFGWSLVNINSYPMVVQMAPAGQTGTYTGLYYFFSSVAAIAGPPLGGLVVDLFGWPALFPAAVVFIGLSFWCLSKVRGGEAQPV